MLSPRRLLWSLLALAAVASMAYTAWLGWQVQGNLTDAEADATRLHRAFGDGDAATRGDALNDLRTHARAAADETDGLWWDALTRVPVIGDDASGVRAMSSSLQVIADDGVQPLADSVDNLGGVTAGGEVDIRAVADLQDPVDRAHRAFVTAAADLDGLDSSGYAGALRSRFNRYAALVDDSARALASASTAAEVLPKMVGADGPRDYLLIFQNNAEIRATGGMPGSWALLHAENGKLTLTMQGTAGEFGERQAPVLPLTKAERALFNEQLGTYFQDAGFTPDFPRAADLMAARWEESYPDHHLDGVISLDPVAMSYLLEGTGPVRVGDVTLTSGNVVETLLNRPYLELEPSAQDVLFQGAARAIFQATTNDLASPLKFLQGLDRAAREGRFLIASFDDAVRTKLAGSRIEGALAGNDGSTPHVDIALNDGTGSKMSYYLRYWAGVKAAECTSGVQTLSGSLSLSQKISPAEAAQLPESVTGGGSYGTKAGDQLVVIPLIGPYGGTIDRVSINGRSLGRHLDTIELDGRPALGLVAQLSSRDETLVNFSMHTGKGQTGDVKLGMTPSIVPGNNDATVKSAC